MQISRYANNPILSPLAKNNWESYATFNGCPVKVDDKTVLLYRAMSQEQTINGQNMRLSTIGRAESTDGVTFNNRTQFIKPEFEWEKYGCEDARVTFCDGTYFICYTALSEYPFNAKGIKSAIAISKDMKTIEKKGLGPFFNSKAMTFFPEKINGKYTALISVHTDMPPTRMCTIQFDTIDQIWDKNYWEEWYSHINEHALPLQRINRDFVEIGAPPIAVEHGWLLLYSYIKEYRSSNPEFGISAVLLDYNQPRYVTAEIREPLLKPQEEYELQGIVRNIVFPSGAIVDGDNLSIYYGGADTVCAVAKTSLSELLKEMEPHTTVKAVKSLKNPLLSPIKEHEWEAQAVFNPAVIEIDGKVHMIYRALSPDNTSTFGYAYFDTPLQVAQRLADPIYLPREDFEAKKVPNGNSGCEDARVTVIGEWVYMCYTAYNGAELPRVAFTKISKQNFLAHNWVWEKPVLISPPGIDDKDAALFPEKIHDRYYFLHRIDGDIVVDYIDDLNFEEKEWLGCRGYFTTRKDSWDSLKVGLNSPPIRTPKGWLVVYHGVHVLDHEYRVGGILLDLKDPRKEIARSEFPFLEPEYAYEREGVVPNVVFPCGAVVLQDTLYMYYGGADTVIGVATMNLTTLVDKMLKSTRSD